MHCRTVCGDASHEMAPELRVLPPLCIPHTPSSTASLSAWTRAAPGMGDLGMVSRRVDLQGDGGEDK